MRYSLRLAQCIEKVHRADAIEKPDQRQRQAPTSSKRYQRQECEQAASEVPIGSREGERTGQRLGNQPWDQERQP